MPLLGVMWRRGQFKWHWHNPDPKLGKRCIKMRHRPREDLPYIAHSMKTSSTMSTCHHIYWLKYSCFSSDLLFVRTTSFVIFLLTSVKQPDSASCFLNSGHDIPKCDIPLLLTLKNTRILRHQKMSQTLPAWRYWFPKEFCYHTGNFTYDQISRTVWDEYFVSWW